MSLRGSSEASCAPSLAHLALDDQAYFTIKTMYISLSCDEVTYNPLDHSGIDSNKWLFALFAGTTPEHPEVEAWL